MRNALIAILVGSAAWCVATSFVSAADESMPDVFKRRILPLFQAKEASSCRECHLTGVDLKDYLADDPRRAFLSLRDQGLADVKDPAKSRLLALIEMAPRNSPVVTTALRTKEREAVLAWLTACAADAELVASPPLKAAEVVAPKAPAAVIRHERTDQVLAAFTESIWADRGRCQSCHDPRQNEKQRTANGDRVSWIVPDDAAATLARMEVRGYFDVKSPEKSLILAKPTARVAHGGGEKMVIGDRGYSRWLAFVRDWATVHTTGYASEAGLPVAPSAVLVNTDLWIRVDSPDATWDGKVMVVELYKALDGGTDYEKTPIAASTRRAGKDGWQHTLYLTAPVGSDRAKEFAKAPTLPTGKYRVKAYLDKGNRLAKSSDGRLPESDLVGTIDVSRGFEPGYGQMAKLGVPAKKR